MKSTRYLYTLLIVLLTACQDSDYLENGNLAADKSVLEFTVHIPEYKVAKRSIDENGINDIHVLAFDSRGLFIERVQATQVTSNNGTGSFKAAISTDTRIVHFVANYSDWAHIDDLTARQKDERELLPELSGTTLAFWGRNTITSLTTPIEVTLYRNQAKITVENNTTNFQVTGFALANFATTGTVAPFDPEASPTPFIITNNLPTMPLGTVVRSSQSEEECDLQDKYMFENENYYNNQTCVIIKGILGNSNQELYYKIQLLDDLKQPYPIIRNSHYRIIIKVFSEEAKGSTTFEDAKSAEASNNIYAEIQKESPTISDTEGNVLTVGGTSYLFIGGGLINIPAHYTMNGIPADTEIEVYTIEDQGNILHGIQYDKDGTISGIVSSVPAGQQEATLFVKAGVLSRTITIISSAYYMFDPMTISPEIYDGIDAPVTISFNIPSNVPQNLFPLECVLTTQNLYPVEPNKNLQVEYEKGSYKYIYWAASPGTKTLNFKTSLQDSDEFIYLENTYFLKDSVKLESRRFINAAVNSTNVVNYGTNSVAQLTFTIADLADNPAQYPLTVHIATDNLKTSAAGWTAETGGYYYTYTSAPTGPQTVLFSSKTPISEEEIVLSATGFTDKKINISNVLSTSQTISGYIYVNYGTGNLSLSSGSRITSSSTSIIPSFRTGTRSSYSVTIPRGMTLSDGATLTYSSYGKAVTIKDLLQNSTIVLVP